VVLYWFTPRSMLIQKFIGLFIDWFANSLIHWLTHSFTDSLIHSFLHWFIGSLIHWFIHSSIHLFIHSFTHSHSLAHSLAHSLTQPSAHWFVHIIDFISFSFGDAPRNGNLSPLISDGYCSSRNFRPPRGRALSGRSYTSYQRKFRGRNFRVTDF